MNHTSLQMSEPWYSMVLSGEKTEEYREFKKFYHQRFKKYLDTGEKIRVTFINGYRKDSKRFDIICTVTKGVGFEKWGAPKDAVYILKVEEVIHD